MDKTDAESALVPSVPMDGQLVDWLSMKDIEKRRLVKASWISLRRLEVTVREESWAEVGFREEFLGVASAMFPVEFGDTAAVIDYNDLNRTGSHRPWDDDGRWVPAAGVDVREARPGGEYLVLEQSFDQQAPQDWHLHQDVVLGLGLRRVGDEWIAPLEEDVVVAMLHRSDEGDPNHLEIRAEHLRDFLCARRFGLAVGTFSARRAVETGDTVAPWPTESRESREALGSWEFYSRLVNESGFGIGEEMAVTTISRTDTIAAGEAPVFDPRDESAVASTMSSHKFAGEERLSVEADFRRTEWFAPGDASPRVRGDRESLVGLSYRADADGALSTAEELLGWPIRYLYFNPGFIADFLDRKTSELVWLSTDTGGISVGPYSLHFGINSIGLVNVIGGHVAQLPRRLQDIMVAHNVTPSQEVSDELLAVEQRLTPSTTVAPEDRLREALEACAIAGKAFFGAPLYKDHPALPSLRAKLHRFRSTDASGLRALAKDIYRVTVEAMDDALLAEKAPPPPRGEEWRSIKRLEVILRALEPSISLMRFRRLNDLRQDDAHLPSAKRVDVLSDLRISTDGTIMGGRDLIATIADQVEEISRVLRAANSQGAG